MSPRAALSPVRGRAYRVRRGLALALAMLLLWAAAIAPLVSRLLAPPQHAAGTPWAEVCHSPGVGESHRPAQAGPEGEACGYCKLFHRLPLLRADMPAPIPAPAAHAMPWQAPVPDRALRRLWHPPGRGPPVA